MRRREPGTERAGASRRWAEPVCGLRPRSSAALRAQRRGRWGENFDIGLAEPIYRMRSVGAVRVESRFHAAGNRSRVAAAVPGTPIIRATSVLLLPLIAPVPLASALAQDQVTQSPALSLYCDAQYSPDFTPFPH